MTEFNRIVKEVLREAKETEESANWDYSISDSKIVYVRTSAKYVLKGGTPGYTAFQSGLKDGKKGEKNKETAKGWANTSQTSFAYDSGFNCGLKGKEVDKVIVKK